MKIALNFSHRKALNGTFFGNLATGPFWGKFFSEEHSLGRAGSNDNGLSSLYHVGGTRKGRSQTHTDFGNIIRFYDSESAINYTNDKLINNQISY
jgi:hypothetical protein